MDKVREALSAARPWIESLCKGSVYPETVLQMIDEVLTSPPKGEEPTDETIQIFAKAADGIGCERGSFLWDQYDRGLRAILSRLSPPKGEEEIGRHLPHFPNHLHPKTADLVCKFAVALAKKLRLAEVKYGYTDGWSRDDWESECRQHLYRHLDKGDPKPPRCRGPK